MAVLCCFQVILVLHWSWWQFPRSIKVGPKGIRVEFFLRTVFIAAGEITEVRVLRADDLKGFWSLWKCAWGTQRRTKEFGTVEAYTDAYSDLVLVRAKGRRPILLGVDFPEEFVEALGLARRTTQAC